MNSTYRFKSKTKSIMASQTNVSKQNFREFDAQSIGLCFNGQSENELAAPYTLYILSWGRSPVIGTISVWSGKLYTHIWPADKYRWIIEFCRQCICHDRVFENITSLANDPIDTPCKKTYKFGSLWLSNLIIYKYTWSIQYPIY